MEKEIVQEFLRITAAVPLDEKIRDPGSRRDARRLRLQF